MRSPLFWLIPVTIHRSHSTKQIWIDIPIRNRISWLRVLSSIVHYLWILWKIYNASTQCFWNWRIFNNWNFIISSCPPYTKLVVWIINIICYSTDIISSCNTGACTTNYNWWWICSRIGKCNSPKILTIYLLCTRHQVWSFRIISGCKIYSLIYHTVSTSIAITNYCIQFSPKAHCNCTAYTIHSKTINQHWQCFIIKHHLTTSSTGNTAIIIRIPVSISSGFI